MGHGLAAYRVVLDSGHQDVLVTIRDTATVADLARSIARRTGSTGGRFHDGSAGGDDGTGHADTRCTPTGCTDGLTLETVGETPVAVDPARPAAEAAPPSGSTVRVVAARTTSVRPPFHSPVSLEPIDPAGSHDDRQDARQRMTYGTTVMGGALLKVGSTITLHATGATERLEVDGVPVRGSAPARHGSILRVGETAYVLHVDGSLRPPVTTGPWRQHRAAAAVHEEPEAEPIELPTPPSADRIPGFPFLSALVPLLMGAAMWVATRSLAVAGFVLFSVAFVVASGIEARREHQRDRRFRERLFEHDLATATESARERRAEELMRARRDLPSGTEVAEWALGDRHRTWERRPVNHGALRVRIGIERVPPHDPVVVPRGGRDDLRTRLEETATELAELERPVAVDLSVSGLAVVGAGVESCALARSVIAQLVGLLGPDDLGIEIDAPDERSAAWDWLRWLPHQVAFVHSASASASASERSPGWGRVVVRLVDGHRPRPVDGGPLCVVIVNDEADVPPGCGTVVGLDDRCGWVRRDDGPRREMVPEGLATDMCEPLARALAPLRGSEDSDSTPPGSVRLSEVLADATILQSDGPQTIGARWRASRADPYLLGAPIGQGPGGVMHIDLRADGPHGLVAGTTGSGKSELLRTLVTSLALHHPPDRLTFLLVDYKGGAAFAPVAALPHVVGLVSDLGPATAHRALISLRAEVRRRERIVAAAGASDMIEVDLDRAAPALVVVVDEFATLAREVPDLLDGLLDVAQRGRSLGIHLLLATQRPSGIVTDAVRANMSLRLALRVADEDDSRDIVDVADAAHIPAELPGRAVLRLGPRQSVAFQVADSSAPLWRRNPVDCCELADARAGNDEGPSIGESTITEITAAVANCRAAAEAGGLTPPRRPWVDPLPEHLEMDAGSSSPPGRLVIGEADLPDEQRRGPASIDLRSGGNVLVIGPPRSGRSTALDAVAFAAVSDPTTPTTVYGIDGARSLAELIGRHGPAGRIGDVISVDDVERTLRLLRMLRNRVARNGHDRAMAREGGTRTTPGRTVLLLDGIGPLVERHDDVNRAEAVDLLVSIASGGPAVGIHLVATAGRAAEVPSALAPSFDRLLMLRSTSAWELNPDPSSPAGRGHLDGTIVQVATPTWRNADASHLTADRTGHVATGAIGRLPFEVDSGSLPAAKEWLVPVGIRHDDLDTAVLDLTHSCALIIGPPRSGRSTALRTVLDRLRRTDSGVDVVWLDSTTDSDTTVAALELLADPDRLGPGTSPVDGRGATIVLIDDLPELLDGPHGTILDEALERVLRRGTTSPVRVVASGEADTTARCYADSLRRLRSGRTGILLRPDADLHPGLLHTTLPRHDELAPAPGRGWIVSPDEVVAVQLAH